VPAAAHPQVAVKDEIVEVQEEVLAVGIGTAEAPAV
jgi:hypothetical protein